MTVINEQTVFESPILSCLPYREVLRNEELDYTGFLIDEERIIGMTVRSSSLSRLLKPLTKIIRSVLHSQITFCTRSVSSHSNHGTHMDISLFYLSTTPTACDPGR